MTGLDNLTMCGAVLCGSFLQKVDLHGSNLEGADLRRANLSHANLSRTNLRGTKPVAGRLQLNTTGGAGAQLQAQVLSSTDLRHADLESANLTNAMLLKARIDGARLNRVFAVRATMSEQQRKKLQDVGAQTAAMEEDERFVQTPSIPVNDAGTSSNQICFSNASTVNISGQNSWFRQ